MLRVEFLEGMDDTLVLRLEGRFVGLFADDTRATVLRHNRAPKLIVDLTDVTFIDALGEEVLLWFGRIGGAFVAENLYSRSVCQRLSLTMAARPAPASLR